MNCKQQKIKRKTAEKQLGFKLLEGNNVKHFGGAYLKNSNPKEKRPISIKRTMHLVMRSSLAKGKLSLLRNDDRVRKIIKRQSEIHGVKVYRIANAGNHLHLIILPRSRAAFNSFVRSISGLIVRHVLKLERGPIGENLKERGEREESSTRTESPTRTTSAESHARPNFWDQRPFTRIVEWGRDFKAVTEYLSQNTLEALGFIPYQARKHRYTESTA